MRITVVGGGNIGTQFAVRCAEKGYGVTLLASDADRFSLDLVETDENGRVTHLGRIDRAVSDPKTAVADADVVFITRPAFCMQKTAEEIIPFLKHGAAVGLIPGTGGGECAFSSVIEKGCTLFGLQRVPGVARLNERGRSVCASGYRDELFVAALPVSKTDGCCRLIGDIFEIKCTPLPNYLTLTLTPSNPVLHTSRLRELFRDYRDGVTYKRVPLFYGEWDIRSAKRLIACDAEVQMICRVLDGFDLTYVRSLKIHYESDTPEAMAKKLSGINSLKALTTPMIKTENGFIPDFSSRYFVADFGYGLSILVQIADMFGLAVPNMRDTYDWYTDITGNRKGFDFSDYGINGKKDFLTFYGK